MGHEWVPWVLLTASALHVVEERGLGWQGWAARVLAPPIGIAPSWLDFWATTALLLYLPIGVWAYVAAADDDVLSTATLIGSALLGALAMASVIVLLVLQRRFRYPDRSAPQRIATDRRVGS